MHFHIHVKFVFFTMSTLVYAIMKSCTCKDIMIAINSPRPSDFVASQVLFVCLMDVSLLGRRLNPLSTGIITDRMPSSTMTRFHRHPLCAQLDPIDSAPISIQQSRYPTTLVEILLPLVV